MTGDRVWRMPLFQHYTKQVTDSQLADLNNIGKYSRYVSVSHLLLEASLQQRDVQSMLQCAMNWNFFFSSSHE